ncbi:MAG: transposase [Bacteroidota bacterium]
MIRIISKDNIIQYILPHLSSPKRGGSRVPTWEIVNAIFYKFKSGVQWHLLPVKSLIYKDSIKYGAMRGAAPYHHFRKWVKDGSWQRVQQQIISQCKHLLNLSVALFDGTHSLAKRGGEQPGRRAVAYQGRKKGKTSNTLWLTDANGLVVGFTLPVAGNHHDVTDIERRMDYLVEQLARSGIRVDGLFINADAGFDSEAFRHACYRLGIELNVPRNYRVASQIDDDTYFDELMYEQRYAVERTNAWQDSYRTLLIRQDTSLGSWVGTISSAFTLGSNN